MGTVRFDASQHPIVRVSFEGSDAGDDDVRRFLATLDQNLDRKLSYAIIIEAPALSALSTAHRRALADWVSLRHDDLESYCLAQAYVIPGIIGRMILRSIFMIQPPVNAYRVFTEPREALSWARDVLVHSGVAVPPLRD